MNKSVSTKRIYDKYEKSDGVRILVDRLWQRGVIKEKAHIAIWIKEIAPSDSLRKWFNHDPGKWAEFKEKYHNELNEKEDLLKGLIHKGNSNITLLYAAKNRQYYNAAALKEYLEKKVFY